MNAGTWFRLGRAAGRELTRADAALITPWEVGPVLCSLWRLGRLLGSLEGRRSRISR